MPPPDDAKAAIAALKRCLQRHEDDVGALRAALLRFDAPLVLEISLRVERAIENLAPAQAVVVAAVASAQGPELAADVDGLRVVAARIARLHEATTSLAGKLAVFTRAHARALTTAGTAGGYDRRARLADGAAWSLLQSAG